MPTAHVLPGGGGPSDQFRQRDGRFHRPNALLPFDGDEPVWVPCAVAPTAIVRPAAIVNRQTIVGGKVAVDVDQHFNSIVGRQIGVARTFCEATPVAISPAGRRLSATGGNVKKLGVVGRA